jgi:hypothetical protein
MKFQASEPIVIYCCVSLLSENACSLNRLGIGAGAAAGDHFPKASLTPYTVFHLPQLTTLAM